MILTSNLGSSYILDGIDEKTGEINPEAKEQVSKLLKQSFRPEFLNRLDEIVYYKPLTKSNVTGIIDLLVASLSKRIEDRRLRLTITDKAKDFIVDHGYDPVYGARPLKRYLQSKVETLLAKKMLESDLEPNSELIVEERDGDLTVVVRKPDEKKN